MRISHVCLQCGEDLTRCRALLDSHYALPIVTCPKCGYAVVRRRHPVIERLNSGVGVAGAIVALLVQAVLFAGVVAALVVLNTAVTYFGSDTSPFVDAFRSTMRRIPDANPREVFWRVWGEPISVALGWFAVAVLGGALLTMTMRHHASHRRWLGWGVALFAGQGLLLLLVQAIERTVPSDLTRPDFMTFVLERGAVLTLSMILVAIVVSTIGIPVGWGLLKLVGLSGRGFRRIRRRAYRNRRRIG